MYPDVSVEKFYCSVDSHRASHLYDLIKYILSHFDLIGTEREDRRNSIVPIIKIQRNQSVSIIESAGTQPPAPESGHSAGELTVWFYFLVCAISQNLPHVSAVSAPRKHYFFQICLSLTIYCNLHVSTVYVFWSSMYLV